ncbi:MAG: phage major capsid protein [Immundisolibacterales bacterium]|nr:phage major capsid protein [Immundisolibacterales bacterium]
MKKSTKLELRAIELQQQINGLEANEANLAKRRELLAELDTVQTERRAALEAEAAAGDEHRGGDGLTAEEREFRALEGRAECRNAVHALIQGAELSGAEAEIQRHRGLSGAELPWELIAPRARADRGVEHRVDAVTPAPGTTQDNQRTPLGRVFARSATATLGVEMPSVPVGDVNVPVLSGSQAASNVAKGASVGDAAAGTLTAVTFSPTRIQFEYLMRREDKARMMGLEEVLRSDLSMAVADRVDAQVLAGNGTAPNFGGFLATAANGGLPALTAPSTEVSYELALAELARGVDGMYAGNLGECSMVVGDDTYRKLVGLINTGSGEVAAMTYSRMLSGFMASANIPAPQTNDQEGILARRGAGTNALCPMWGGVTLIVDEVSATNRKQGWISITAVLLSDFKITRADGFSRVAFQLA